LKLYYVRIYITFVSGGFKSDSYRNRHYPSDNAWQKGVGMLNLVRIAVSENGSLSGVLALITAEGVREINYRYLLFERRLIRFDPKDHVAKCAAPCRAARCNFARRSAEKREESHLHI